MILNKDKQAFIFGSFQNITIFRVLVINFVSYLLKPQLHCGSGQL